MATVPYIDRHLRLENQQISTDEFIDKLGVAVVLAEPGAGKTRLLEQLRELLDVPIYRASIFRHKNQIEWPDPLLIDAFDEVAKMDLSAIDQIIVKAAESGIQRVIFATRSSEWAESQTKTVRDSFSLIPLLVYLEAFSLQEQQQYFNAYAPGYDFYEFYLEVERMQLQPLAGNPKFLEMLVDAYFQNNKRFESKAQIYHDSIHSAARESNAIASCRNRPSAEKTIEIAAEIFTKLLLSGASGVAISEFIASIDYPYLNSLSDNQTIGSRYVLDTKLFKPGSQADLHEPSHKIISEYCAARYLTDKIKDQADRFSLEQCLAIMAPNGVIRDELRGLLGWMAPFGDRTIQERAIEIDAYAVLANGDPSQLDISSKRLLLNALKSLWEKDPHFRRLDQWRRFNVSGFFTPELIAEVGVFIDGRTPQSSLTGLLLELLQDFSDFTPISKQLKAILLDQKENESNREMALNLLKDADIDESRKIFQILIAEDTRDSLFLVSRLVAPIGISRFTDDDLLLFVRKLADFYNPKLNKHYKSVFFIKDFIRLLESKQCEFLLDELSETLVCMRLDTSNDDARMRNEAESKVVGLLLDRFFELHPSTDNPERLWRWTKCLRYEHHKNEGESISVRALANNHDLRRSVQQIAFSGLNDQDEIWFLMHESFIFHAHSGLRFRQYDMEALAQFAFETKNLPLWTTLWKGHNIYSKEHAVDPLTRLMRSHSRQNQDFLKAWHKRKHEWNEKNAFFNGRRHKRTSKRWKLKEERRKQNNRGNYEKNKELIESGQHYGWLKIFADLYLFQDRTENDFEYVDDASIEKALRNCFTFLQDHIPTLKEAALWKNADLLRVLSAACLAHFKYQGNLSAIDISVLRVVKADWRGYFGISERESKAFEQEISRLIFIDESSKRNYLIEYLTPQFANQEHSDASWLLEKPEFKDGRAELALEWLEIQSKIPFHTAEYLFRLAATHPDKNRFSQMVAKKFDESKSEKKRDGKNPVLYGFWALRAFLYLGFEESSAKNWLKEDNRNIFGLVHLLGKWDREENAFWINLNARKIYHILDTYVDEWPKVFLPNSWGTDSPENETAYRFLTDIIWKFREANPEEALPLLDKMLEDQRFTEFHNVVKTLKETARRKKALHDFRAPTPENICAFLESRKIVSVENLRALLIDELRAYQKWLTGASTDPVEVFYDGSNHVNETTASKRVVEDLQNRFNALNLSVSIEHHMANSNRCDITVTTVIDGRETMLVIEAKGQWHQELFAAASFQLSERYCIHPSAADQGVYLVYWFGQDVEVEGRVKHHIASAEELRKQLIDSMDEALRSRIDVFVLDLSKS